MQLFLNVIISKPNTKWDIINLSKAMNPHKLLLMQICIGYYECKVSHHQPPLESRCSGDTFWFCGEKGHSYLHSALCLLAEEAFLCPDFVLRILSVWEPLTKGRKQTAAPPSVVSPFLHEYSLSAMLSLFQINNYFSKIIKSYV